MHDEAESTAHESEGKELKFWDLRLDEIVARMKGNHADAEALVRKVEEARLEWRLEMYWKAKDSNAARQTKSAVSHKRKHSQTPTDSDDSVEEIFEMPAKKARVSHFTAFKTPVRAGNKEGRWNGDELEDNWSGW